jgi:NAD-dependent deacetylase
MICCRDIPAITRAIAQAESVVALTGAGVSAESGVPTFRDAQTGLWAQYRAEDLATPEAFARQPGVVWDWYAYRRKLVAQVQPNPAHRALAALEDRVPAVTIITQNVDGLHQRAGSSRVVELHGNIARVRCANCGRLAASWTEPPVPPRCPACDGPLRPDVVWFGELLPRQALAEATAALQSCDVLLVVGTSALVEPAASLPLLAIRRGALVVEINPAPTPLTPLVTASLRGPAGVLVAQVVG